MASAGWLHQQVQFEILMARELPNIVVTIEFELSDYVLAVQITCKCHQLFQFKCDGIDDAVRIGIEVNFNLVVL